jgi:hypothetical protein
MAEKSAGMSQSTEKPKPTNSSPKASNKSGASALECGQPDLAGILPDLAGILIEVPQYINLTFTYTVRAVRRGASTFLKTSC